MKEPKEKALEIYEATKGFRVKNSHRKKCALVAVNECIELPNFINQSVETPLTAYYFKVRTELQAL